MSCYTSQNVLTNYKQRCEQPGISTIRTSSKSHLFWKKHFCTNILYFRKKAGLEAENEIDDTHKSNKTTIIWKQNPVCNGYYIVSELHDVSKSGYYESFLG